MRCKNCVYWKNWKDITGRCRSPKWVLGCDVADERIQPDGIIIENKVGWGMFSAPDFGCVHFMEKEEQE